MKFPIYKPKPIVDKGRERLIKLLSRHLEERILGENKNIHPNQLVLSDAEIRELEALIEEILTDKRFFYSLSFVDGLIGRDRMSQDQLRELYLSERRLRGYSRAVSSSQWHQFKTRLGMRSGDLSTLVRSAQRMPFDHFKRMEFRLLSHFEIHEKVKNYLMSILEKRENSVEEIRDRLWNLNSQISEFGLRDETSRVLEKFREKRDSLSSVQTAGLTIAVVDTTALFTTRDWSVAGTLSMIGSGIAMYNEK